MVSFPRHVNVCRPFLRCRPLPPRAVAPAQSLNRWPRPRLLGQLKQGHHVTHAGARPAQDPAPHGVGMDAESTGDLRPRQPRLLLEPHEPLREVVGEAVGLSGVVYALSRHLVGLPQGTAGATRPTRAQASPFSYASARGLPGFRSARLPHLSVHVCLLFLLPRTRAGPAGSGRDGPLPRSPRGAHPCPYWPSPSPGKPQAVFDLSLSPAPFTASTRTW